jgi:hypothetical protein
LGRPFQVEFRVRYFDYSWLLQENGILMCSNGKNVRVNAMPTPKLEPGTLAFVDRYTFHLAIHDPIHSGVKLIQ